MNIKFINVKNYDFSAFSELFTYTKNSIKIIRGAVVKPGSEQNNLQEETDNSIYTISLQDTNDQAFFNLLKNQIRNLNKYINFSTPVHYEEKIELNKSSDINEIFKFTVDFNYNFLIEDYEEALKQTTLFNTERKILNYYDLYQENDIMSPLSFSQIFSTKENLSKIINKQRNSPATIIYNNVILDKNGKEINFFEFLSSAHSNKNLFPFYAKIKFDNIKIENYNNSIYKLIKEKKIFDSFFKYHIGNSETINLTVNSNTSPEETKAVKITNLDNFLLDTTTFDILSISYFSNYLDQNLNIENILTNNNISSEVIGYKISKYDRFGPSPSSIQDWYVPADSSENAPYTELLDSQIFYNKNYAYKISSLVLSISNTVNILEETESSIKFQINNSFHLFEIEGPQYSNILLDYPPIKPEVQFIPYIGVDNKIKIDLNSSIGVEKSIPVYLSDIEEVRIQKIKQSQNSTSKITYRSDGDERRNFFEIYRLDRKPKSFIDFLEGDKSVIEAPNISSVSVENYLIPNKKYYYIFRIIDYHGNFSNLSDVYLVEMINDSGVIFPNVQVYNLETFRDEELETKSRKFKKRLYVAPSFSNIYFDSQDIEIQNINNKQSILPKLKVGLNQEAVWDKKFKIRLTSLSTGKKLDINFVFKLNKD